MNEEDSNDQLVQVGPGALALTNLADNRILSEMVGSSLVLATEPVLTSVDLDSLVEEGKRLTDSAGRGMTEENVRGFRLFLRAAEAGHSEAQLCVANAYFAGDGVAEDRVESFKWLRKSAEQGNEVAEYNICLYYHWGEGVAKDNVRAIDGFLKFAEHEDDYVKDACQMMLGECYSEEGPAQNNAEAAKWFKKAAEKGNVDAQLNLGDCYHNGKGVPRDHVEAVKWFRKAAEGGHCEAQYILGDCYDLGDGVAQDYAEAVKWYRRSAEQGFAPGQSNLGACYGKGLGVAQDYAESVKWYRRAAEQGFASAQFNLGCCYSLGQGVSSDIFQAYKWFQLAADQGHEAAKNEAEALAAEMSASQLKPAREPNALQIQTDIGELVLEGRALLRSEGGGMTKENIRAYDLFLRAAEAGHSEAQYFLGSCYFGGHGVARDFKAAVKWYRKAAEQGDATAQCFLGTCYGGGHGVAQSYEVAVQWITKSAEQGSADGQYYLGMSYWEGLGVKENILQAYKWLHLAAEQGDQIAIEKAASLAALMSAAELNAALRLCHHEEGNKSKSDYEKALSQPVNSDESIESSRQFFILQNNEQSGPYSNTQIREFLEGRKAYPLDLAWCEGLEEWTPLYKLPEFSGPSSAVICPSNRRTLNSSLPPTDQAPSTEEAEIKKYEQEGYERVMRHQAVPGRYIGDLIALYIESSISGTRFFGNGTEVGFINADSINFLGRTYPILSVYSGELEGEISMHIDTKETHFGLTEHSLIREQGCRFGFTFLNGTTYETYEMVLLGIK